MNNYTLIDYTRNFHFLCKTLKLSASVRSVYAAIVGEANEARFPERIGISDRELKELAGLKSVATVHEAKNVLKNHGLIDFDSKNGRNGRTEYKLLTEHFNRTFNRATEHLDTATEHLQPNISAKSASNQQSQPNTNRTFTEHQPNIYRTQTEHLSGFLNMRARREEDVEDIKTSTLNDNCAGADKLDLLLDYWSDVLRGGRLSFEHISEVSVLLRRYGFDWVRDAMKAAADSNNNPRGVSPKYFFAIAKSKGGESSETKAATRKHTYSSDKYQYRLPVYTGNEPWFDEKFD